MTGAPGYAPPHIARADRAPNVIHVIAPGPFGGAESVVAALASGRSSTGAPTSVAALVTDAYHPFVRNLVRAGVPVAIITAPERQYMRQARLLSDYIRLVGADIVHTHIYHADFVGYVAAKRAGCRAVATFHGHVGGAWPNWLYEWSDRQLLSHFDSVVCVSHRNRRRLLWAGCRSRRLHVVPNGMVTEAPLPRDVARTELGLAPDGPVIGWVGRVASEKGPDLMLNAMERLARRDATLVLVGDGPDREQLERRVSRHGMSSRVVFAGSRANAARLFSAFDLLAISSRTEGLPMVMLEAAAQVLPVVAFAVGGIPEVLDTTTAWLARPNDTAALAAHIGSALDNPGERRARAGRARARCEKRLNNHRWMQEIERVYARVIARRGVSSRP
jgi:glycosyltransferase involved in cell wall biosynthesis